MKNFKQLTEQEFIEQVRQYEKEFGEELIDEFISYWTEPGVKQMKFQYEKTWEAHRRLKTWLRNKNKFNRQPVTTGAVSSTWVFDPKKDNW
jgi:hypothetical protein